MSDPTSKPAPAIPGRGQVPPGLDTRLAHSARIYDYWLGSKDNFAADREAAEQAIAANPGIVADVRANRAFLARAVRHLAADCGIRQFLDIGTGLPAGSYLVLSHPASDIRTAAMAEMTRLVNRRLAGPPATMRDRAAISRFFDGLELLEPGVVQPQQWRPEPDLPGPSQVTAWCGVARKP
jgi:hypothetical protein